MLMQPEANRYRILIVDDDPSMLELLDTRLSLAGYRTIQARDGYDGLNKLRDTSPHAMLLDINMPRLDGFEVLRAMRKQGFLPRVPVMVLTARNQPADVQEAVKLGASDFLTKPFDDQRLLARVARLVRSVPGRSGGGGAAPGAVNAPASGVAGPDPMML